MKQKSKRVLSVFLSISFLLSTLQGGKIIKANELNESDKGERTIIREIIEKRTENQKVFLNSDGTYTARVYQIPIHYKKDGKFEDIDNSLVLLKSDNVTGEKIYRNKANDVNVEMKENFSSESAISVNYDKYKISFKPNVKTNSKSNAIKKQDYISSKKFNNVSNNEKAVDENIITTLEYDDADQNLSIQYSPQNRGVKEELAIKSYKGINRFEAAIRFEGLKPTLENDGTIILKDISTNEGKAFIAKPFMYDSSDNIKFSDNINVKIEKVNDKEELYKLIYTVDKNFLEDKSTTYPVTIDPTITYGDINTTQDNYVESAYPNSNYKSEPQLRAGYDSSTGTVRSYIKYPNLPSIEGGKVLGARFCAYGCNYNVGEGNNAYINLHKVLGNWDSSTITWNNAPSYDSTVLAQAAVSCPQWYYWDITSLVSGWYSGSIPNYGFVMKDANESWQYRRFYSSNGDVSPCIQIVYSVPPSSPTGLSYQAFGNGVNSGSGYVNLSWNAVSGAAGYMIALFDGKCYEYFDAGNTTVWTTKGAKIWPTTIEILNGRYELHHDGLGGDLPNDPSTTYQRYEKTIDQNSHNYWFRVLAYNQYGQISYLYGNGVTPTLPDTTPPNNVLKPSLTFSNIPLNSGGAWKATVSWNGTSDLPTEIASGVSFYKVQIYDVSKSAVVKEANIPSNQTSATFDGLADNKTYRAAIAAYDTNGNFTSVSTFSDDVYAQDRTAPSIPAEVKFDHSSWSNTNTDILNWDGITDNVGVKIVQYCIDSGEWIDTGSNLCKDSVNINISNLSDGEHQVYIRAIDYQGNIGASKGTKYYKDTTLPQAFITSPLSLQTVNKLVDISGTINDEHLKNWVVEYGKGNYPSTFTKIASGTNSITNQVICSWDTTNLEDDNYLIRLTIRDLADNISTTSVQVLKSKFITISPSLQIDSPKNNTIINQLNNSVIYQRINNGGTIGLKGKLYINSNLVSEEKNSGDGLKFNALDYSEGVPNSMYVEAVDNDLNKLYSLTTYKERYTWDTILTEKFENENMLENIQNVVVNSDLSLVNNSDSQYLQYECGGSVETKTVSLNSDVNWVKICAKESMPLYTNVNYQISLDGGTTWQYLCVNEKTKISKQGRNVKLKINLYTDLEQYTPRVDDINIQCAFIPEDVLAKPTHFFTVKLIDEPKNLTATPNVNYTTLLRWDYDLIKAGLENITFNVYRGTSEDFKPALENRIAEGLKTSNWNDFNLNYGQKFYYKVTACKVFNNKPRESIASNVCSATIVAKDEVEKRLGLEDYWGFSQFRTGSGAGFINLSSGNLCYQSTDYVYPGSKFALVMRRSLNSQSTTKTSLGYGWDFSFNTNLLKEYNTEGKEVGIMLKDGDGSIHRFLKKDDGTYSAAKGLYMELIQNPDGSYKVKRKDNIEYIFDKTMKLQKFIEPNGNYIELSYNSRGNISSVKDNLNNSTSFEYDNKDRLVKIVDPSGKAFNYIYNDYSDRLTKMYTIIENNVEFSEEYIYDELYKNVLAIKDPNKNITSIEYSNGMASKITDSINEFFNITYNSGTTAITTDRGKTTTFNYNNNGSITKEIDPLNHSINYEYDENYNMTREWYINNIQGTDTNVNYYYSYDEKGNITSIKDPLNNITEFYDYNSFNKVGEVKAPISSNSYTTTKYSYDSYGNLKSTTDAENRTTSYNYDGTGNLTGVTDNFGNITTYSYDNKNRIIKIAEPMGKTTEILEFDAQNNPTKIKDSLGRVTQNVYDLLGRLVRVKYPDDKFVEYSYDLNSNLRQQTNRRGFSTKYDYDAIDRLITTVSADDKVYSTSYGYGSDNNVIITKQDAENRSSKSYYDAAGRVTKEERGGTYVTYDYDNIGNVIKVKDAEGRESTAIYNILNQQVKLITDPLGMNIQNEFTYDLRGKKLNAKDGEGNLTSYEYDKIGRLKKVSNTVAGQIISTAYGYDIREGQLIANKVIDPLGRENITYFDSLGRKVKQVKDGTTGDTERLITQFEYDLGGNLKKITKPDQKIIAYDYDSLDRLSKVQYDTSTYTSYSYDDNGNRTAMNDCLDGNNLATSYHYDKLDRLDQIVQSSNSGKTVNTINYEYDGSGNRIKTYYAEGTGTKNIEYKYDGYNRLQSILVNGSTVRAYNYTPSGKIDYLNNYRKFDTNGTDYTRVNYSYNSAGLPTQISYLENGTTKREEYSLSFDKRGYIKTEKAYTNYQSSEVITNPKTPGTEYVSIIYPRGPEDSYPITPTPTTTTEKTIDKTFNYDEIGRLLSVANNTENKTISYTYDAVGNRLTMNDSKDNYAYSYNQFNSLTEIKKNGAAWSTFGYDANGNQIREATKKDINGTIKDITTNFNYDNADRLTQLSISDGTTTKNIYNYYNGDGQRIQQKDDGAITNYYYVGSNLLYTTDANNSKGQEHVLDPSGIIVASKRFDGSYSNMYFFYNYDIRGSVTNITRPDGTVVKGYSYDEFGATEEKGPGSFKNDVKFTGAVHDASPNLYYMNSRFYNPTTGRFLTQDSYSGNAYEPWTQHLYSYGVNNPVNYVDPTGHAAKFCTSDGGSSVGNNGITKLPPFEDNDSLLLPERIILDALYPMGALENITQDNSPLGNWIEGYTGKTIFTHDKLSEKQKDESTLRGWDNFASGLLTLGCGRVKNIGEGSGSLTGKMSGWTTKADFYVKPNGDVIPSTGYRYMDSKYAKQTMATKSAPGSYFGFKKMNSAAKVQDAFQIAPKWSNSKLRGEFDTLQVIDDIYVPKTYGNTGTEFEPLTVCYPEYGKGGTYQLKVDKVIKFNNVTIIGD